MRRWYGRYFGISRCAAGVPPAVSLPASDSAQRGPLRRGRGGRPVRRHLDAPYVTPPCAPDQPVGHVLISRSRAARVPLAPRTSVADAPVLRQGRGTPEGLLARGTLGLPSAVDQYQSLMDTRACVVHPCVMEDHSPLQTCMPWCGAPLTGADPEPGSQPPGGEGAARRPQRRAGARRRVQDGQRPHTTGGPPLWGQRYADAGGAGGRPRKGRNGQRAQPHRRDAPTDRQSKRPFSTPRRRVACGVSACV
jgi:hypothetical protein